MTSINHAEFKINGSPPNDPVTGNRGYVAEHDEELTLTLDINPSSGFSARYEVFSSDVPDSPLASKNAPELLFSGSGLYQEVLTDPNGTATLVLPSSGCHSWVIRCTVSTVWGQDVFERAVSILSDHTTPPLHKTVPGETNEFQEPGWSDDENDIIDAINSVAGGGGSYEYTARDGGEHWEDFALLYQGVGITLSDGAHGISIANAGVLSFTKQGDAAETGAITISEGTGISINKSGKNFQIVSDYALAATLTDTYVGVGNSSNRLSGSANLIYDSDGDRWLRIGAGTPDHLTGENDCLYVVGPSEFDNVVHLDVGAVVYDDQVIGFGDSSEAILGVNISQANDTFMLGLASPRAFVICEKEDVDVSLGIPIYSNPTLRIQASDATDITKFGSLSHTGADFKIRIGKGSFQIDDEFIAGSTYASPFLVAASAGEYDTFETIFGEVSIVAAINTAGVTTLTDTYIGVGVDGNVLGGTEYLTYDADGNRQLLIGTGTPARIGSIVDSLYVDGKTELNDYLYCEDYAYFYGHTVHPDNRKAYFGNGSFDGALTFSVVQTNDAFMLGVGEDSNTLLICQSSDVATNFDHSAYTDPTLVIQYNDVGNIDRFARLSALGLDIGDGNTITFTEDKWIVAAWGATIDASSVLAIGATIDVSQDEVLALGTSLICDGNDSALIGTYLTIGSGGYNILLGTRGSIDSAANGSATHNMLMGWRQSETAGNIDAEITLTSGIIYGNFGWGTPHIADSNLCFGWGLGEDNESVLEYLEFNSSVMTFGIGVNSSFNTCDHTFGFTSYSALENVDDSMIVGSQNLVGDDAYDTVDRTLIVGVLNIVGRGALGDPSSISLAVIGYNIWADGSYTFAIGQGNKFDVNHSIISGYGNTVQDCDYCRVGGQNNDVSGTNAYYQDILGYYITGDKQDAGARGRHLRTWWPGADHRGGEGDAVSSTDGEVQGMSNCILIGETSGDETVTLKYKTSDSDSPLYCPPDHAIAATIKVLQTSTENRGIKVWGTYEVVIWNTGTYVYEIQSSDSDLPWGPVDIGTTSGIVAFNKDDTNDVLRISCTGASGHAYTWIAKVDAIMGPSGFQGSS
jgi:hypothetical protein